MCTLADEIRKIRRRHKVAPYGVDLHRSQAPRLHELIISPQCFVEQLTLIRDNIALALTSDSNYVRGIAEKLGANKEDYDTEIEHILKYNQQSNITETFNA